MLTWLQLAKRITIMNIPRVWVKSMSYILYVFFFKQSVLAGFVCYSESSLIIAPYIIFRTHLELILTSSDSWYTHFVFYRNKILPLSFTLNLSLSSSLTLLVFVTLLLSTIPVFISCLEYLIPSVFLLFKPDYSSDRQATGELSENMAEKLAVTFFILLMSVWLVNWMCVWGGGVHYSSDGLKKS